MAYGTFISELEKIKSEIENTVFDIEHNFTTQIETGSLGLYSIVYDLENMTDDDFEELYPYDDLNSIRNQYEHLLEAFKLLLDRFLVCSYKEGEWNIVYSDSYEYKGERVPTFELLSLLPNDYELKEHTPEEQYNYSLNPYNEHAGKISLFVAARAGFVPAIKLAKEKYGWTF